MVKGIGVDMVEVAEVKRLMRDAGGFIKKTFTEKEVELSGDAASKEEYFSARFAVKEAVFKAVAHLTEKKTFDFRRVETLNAPDGHPYVNLSGELAPLFAEAGIEELLVSISTEKEYVIAFVIAQ